MNTIKIVGFDTFARETVADRLLIDRIPEDQQAKAEEFCNWLNEFTCDDYGGTYYRVVKHDYRLYRGMEDLI